MFTRSTFAALLCSSLILSGCIGAVRENANLALLSETGLKQEEVDPDGMGGVLTKNHRGYPILVRTHMGNVWGRYAARMAIGEVGRAVGGIIGFLAGQHGHFNQVPGSQFDKLLSDVIGQPLSIVVVLKHGKTNASRLDIVSTYSTIKPYDLAPSRGSLGFLEENVYAVDSRFAERLLANRAFRDRVENFRSEYIRVDENAVMFIFAGTETDYSYMINRHDSYGKFLNSIMDALADAAGEIDG